MNDERCENCKFWNRYSPGHNIGDCRRYPPSVYADGDGDPIRYFSEVVDTDWCGEWKAKEEARKL